VISNATLYPLDLIITRLQIQQHVRNGRSRPEHEEYTGVLDAAKKIYENEGGVVGFYTGLLADTGKILADSFIFFLAYSFLRNKRVAAKRSGESLPALDELGVGFLAGSFTKLVTAPIANIVTRKQAAALVASQSSGERHPAATPSTRDIVQSIKEEKGWRGFWAGYSASLILTLNPTLTFFLFETSKKMLLPRSRRDHPPPSATFLLSAFSKACATAITYPFSLAKARVQSGMIENNERKEVEEEVATGRDIRRISQQATHSTIFSTLLTIAHTEGVSTLYEGLSLEILRSFFSHGITMLVKQIIQHFLVKAYYLLSIVLGRYKRRSREQRLAEKAKSSVEYYNLAMARASQRMEDAKNAVKERANETAEFVAEYVEEETGDWRDHYNTIDLGKWLESDRKEHS